MTRISKWSNFILKALMLTEHFFYSEHNDIKCSYLIQQAISESYDKCGSLYLLNRCPVGKGKKTKQIVFSTD